MSDPVRVWWTHRVRAAVAVRGPCRAVLYALADRAGDDGLAWPGQAQIALDAGVSDRTVREALKVLQASGHVEHQGTRHGADVWRLTFDDAGNPTGDRNGAPVRNGAPAEAGSARTGTGLRKDRKRAPDAPERGSYKGIIEGISEGTKEGGSASADERTTAPDPSSATGTKPPPAPANEEPKHRTTITGTKPMPTTDEGVATMQATIATLAARWRAVDPDGLTVNDERALARLVNVAGDDAGLVVDWLTTAERGDGYDRAVWHHGRGLRETMRGHSDRVVLWARAWAKAGRPSRHKAAGAPATTHADPAAAAWSDMEPRLVRTDKGGRNVHNPGGILLAGEYGDEHHRRRLAWRALGGVNAWGRADSDFASASLRRRWLTAYAALAVLPANVEAA